MGSDHGWSFGDRSYLKNSIAISAGLGQDASFDIEFINKYHASVFIVDPTPTSVDYFENIVLNFGNSKEVEYVNGGAQPVNAYDLNRVNDTNLKLITKALYDKVGDVKFFSPKIEGFNSRSISNIFKTEDFIMVQAVTFSKLLEELEIKSTEVVLVKLDIEGSACEVLFDFLGDSCLPKQLLIEFEEIFIFSFSNAKKLYKTFKLLNAHNYKLIHTDKIGNFTFELNL
jgi:FkbM family methyltransferase